MSHKIVEWNYVCKSKNQRQSNSYFWVKLLLIYWDFNKRGFPFDSKVLKYINNLIYLFIDKGITHDMDFFCLFLTLSFIMLKNIQNALNILGVHTWKCLKYVWPFLWMKELILFLFHPLTPDVHSKVKHT